MASEYPGALPSFTNPTSTDYLNSPAHATQHADANDEITAIATKLGIGASAATGATSGDVLVADGTGSSAWGSTLAGVKTFSGAVTFSAATKSAVKADTDGATITFDLDVANIHTVTLGGNRTLAISNEDAGQVFILRLLQDGTGSRTVTWFSTIKWAGGSAPTLTTTAGKADVFGFLVTGTDAYDGFIVGQNI